MSRGDKRALMAALAAAAALVACATVVSAAAARSHATVPDEPVPSLTPAATQKLWTQLVEHPAAQPQARAQACAPVRVVVYAATDWRRVATKLAANPSSCAQYYVSVPPNTTDKSQLRADEAWRIRALGPAFHALAEINVTGWTS